MHVISQPFHVWKFAIGMNHSLRIPPALPTIIDDDVLIARVPHTASDHGIRGSAHIGISDLVCKMVPTVPSHWRCSCHLLYLRLDVCCPAVTGLASPKNAKGEKTHATNQSSKQHRFSL